MKRLANILIAAIAVVFVLLVITAHEKAGVADVKAVVDLARESPKAEARIKEFLNGNPSPSNGDLVEIKKEINEILVVEQSKAVTGNANLKTEKEVTASSAAAKEANSPKIDRLWMTEEVLAKPWGERTTDEILITPILWLTTTSGGTFFLLALITFGLGLAGLSAYNRYKRENS